MEWLNEPPEWRDEGGVLHVVTGDRTDFWRHTHYGFVRDDGHLQFRHVDGDFTAEVEFAGDYEHLYDQAGLMLRLDAERWLKAGVEYVDGRRMLSVVATRGWSDWSTAPATDDAAWLRLRVTRHADAVRVDCAAGDGPYRMLRLAHLPEGPTAVGPMCCSPERAGFRARFRSFAVGAPIGRDLHA